MSKMQDNIQEQQHNGEIFRLHSSDNGCSCNQHVCWGHNIVPGHIVQFRTEVMEILYHVPGDPELDARIKTMIKAVLVHYSTELCTIMVFTKACGCKT